MRILILTLAFTSAFQLAAAQELDAPAAISDPSVIAALELPRSQPLDYITVIEALVAFDRTDLAATIVDELVALDLDAPTRIELVRQIGSARLLKLALNKQLPEAMRTFAQESVAAAGAAAASPDRIAELTRQLSDVSNAKQQEAVRELANIGEPAVAPVLGLLARPDAPDASRGPARQALLRLQPASAAALLAALETKRPTLKADMAELLVGLRVTQAAGPLAVAALVSTGDAKSDARIAAAFAALAGEPASPSLAKKLLERSIENALAGVPLFTPTDGVITTYTWDDANGKLTRLDLDVADANLLHAARLADALAVIASNPLTASMRAARLKLEANAMSREISLGEVDFRLFSTAELGQLLGDSIAAKQFAAAEATLAELTTRRDPTALAPIGTEPSSVALALQSPSPRVRQAALATIGAIDLPAAFAGSSYVCESLVHSLTAHGRRVAVAGAPRLDVAATWVGTLAAAGIEGEAVSNGEQVVEVATASADVEQVWIDMTIGTPDVREVVFRLRRNPNTALVPIVLIARETQLTHAEQIAREHDRVIARLRPHSEAARLAIGDELAQLLPRDWPTADERLAAADAAAGLVRQFLADGRDFYRLRSGLARRASDINPLVAGDKSWQTLALLGTPGSQETLVSFANRGLLTDDQRKSATAALATSIDKYGVLLTTEQIARQYDLYNQALAVERPDAAILSKVLDAIEAPRRREMKGAE